MTHGARAGPVQLDRYSEPEPDLAIVAPREDFHAGGHPGPIADMLA